MSEDWISQCRDCVFYREKPGAEGFCHRHAPYMRLLVTTDKYIESYGTWPVVQVNDSCGDYSDKYVKVINNGAQEDKR